jgi:hypothetical protein
LYSPGGQSVGFYSYHENQDGTFVDDYLVFE